MILLSAEVHMSHHYAHFRQCWSLNPGLCVYMRANAQPTQLRAQHSFFSFVIIRAQLRFSASWSLACSQDCRLKIPLRIYYSISSLCGRALPALIHPTAYISSWSSYYNYELRIAVLLYS